MTENIKITFLGTSAAVPTKKRNHTAILLTYKGENILLDCGEGTQRQFKFARINPQKLTKLLITHWHGDHVLGIPGLIQTLAFNDYRKTLNIYGQKGIQTKINNVLRAFPSVQSINILKSSSGNQEVVTNVNLKTTEVISGKFFETDDFYLETKTIFIGIPVNLYNFVKKGQIRIDKKKLRKSKLPSGPLLKKLKQGKDITYSGKKYKAKDLTYKEGEKKISFVFDIPFDKRIIPFVKNSDLLICESTYDSSITDLAKDHKHLTAKQAAEIAKKSNSKKLILTHISDRYERNMKLILDEAKKTFKESILAKDLDVINLK